MGRAPTMHFIPAHHPPNIPPPSSTQQIADPAFARFSLEKKSAIVTGGARGLGQSIAGGLLEHGVDRLAVADIDTAEGEQAVKQLRSVFPNRDIRFITLDVTDERKLSSTVRGLADEFESIDILVCFAGIVESVRAVDYTPESFAKILEVNTNGTFFTAQAVGREMIRTKTSGSIILTASMAGHIVNVPQVHVAYGTSKAAVQHMTRCLAAEWAGYGIRVNSLSPGYMDTRLNASDDLTDVRPIWLERTPMGRMGSPNELIGPVILLASSAGSFMTGSDIKIDGIIPSLPRTREYC